MFEHELEDELNNEWWSIIVICMSVLDTLQNIPPKCKYSQLDCI
jgi:hypothetical protein